MSSSLTPPVVLGRRMSRQMLTPMVPMLALTAAEENAGRVVLAFLRRVVLRRRWRRIAKMLLMKKMMGDRLEREREEQRRADAALTIFRCWKGGARSFRGVAMRAIRARKEETIREVMAKYYDFSNAKELSSDRHVDWQDLVDPASRVTSNVHLDGSKQLEERLNDILGLEESIFADVVPQDLERTAAEVAGLLRQSKPNLAMASSPDESTLSAAAAAGAPVIDACTPEALVFFVTNPKYTPGRNIWESMVVAMPEWIQGLQDQVRLLRLFHCRYMQGDAQVRELCQDALEIWLDRFKSSFVELWDVFVPEARKLNQEDEFCDALLALINSKSSKASAVGNRRRHHRLKENELVLLAIANASPTILPPKDAPKPWRVPNIPQLELARQITLNEYEIFSYIRSSEFFGNAWAGKHRNTRAANVTLLTNRFNKFAAWVSGLILAEKTAADRAHMIQYFLITQRHLFHMNNFNGVLELHAVLSSSHIARLAASWALVPPVDLLTFSQIDGFVSPAGNYRAYRKILEEVRGEPCIPYLGAWLTDLTFLAEQRSWILREEEMLDPLINVTKLSKIGSTIRQLEAFQKIPFPFVYNQEIGYYVMEAVTNTEVDSSMAGKFYELSLALEPRNPNFKHRVKANLERGRFQMRGRLADSSRMDMGVQVTGADVTSPRNLSVDKLPKAKERRSPRSSSSDKPKVPAASSSEVKNATSSSSPQGKFGSKPLLGEERRQSTFSVPK